MRFFEVLLLWIIVSLSQFLKFSFLGKTLSTHELHSVFIKTVLISLILLLSKRANKTVSSWRAYLGLTLAFCLAVFIEIPESGNFFKDFGFFSGVFFYFSLTILAYFSLGRSLSLLPAHKGTKTTQAYSVLRHPIYSGYIHILLLVLVAQFSISNLILIMGAIGGLLLRAKTEEELLLASDPLYAEYCNTVKFRFFRPIISIPLIVFATIIILSFNISKVKSHAFKVHSSLAPLSLNPLKYDDFGSVFLGNHIYRRLSVNSERAANYTVAESIEYQCLTQNKECSDFNIYIKIKELNYCNGKPYSTDDFISELRDLLKNKNWIFPSWTITKISKDNILLKVNGVRDPKRRLESIYLRFGWMEVDPPSDGILKNIGLGPYCAESVRFSNGVVKNAQLTFQNTSPSRTNPINKIDFETIEDPEATYDINLYGSPKLIRNSHKNIRSHTPVAYYLVSHPHLANHNRPWFHERTIKVLKNYLQTNGLLYSSDSPSFALFPNFQPAIIDTNEIHAEGFHRSFLIPEYFPDCEKLVNTLNLNSKGSQDWAYCGDINALIQNSLRQNQNWSAFLTPLIPGVASREGTYLQYFSSQSKDSWFPKKTKIEDSILLLGLGDNLITIDESVVCGLKANPLGLADLLVDDFDLCK